MRRIKLAIVACVTLLAATMSAAPAAAAEDPAAPAGAPSTSAASVDGWWFVNAETDDCLDQHYDKYNLPTVTITAWWECHDKGNQQWRVVHHAGIWQTIRNSRSGWCLSAPNGVNSVVFAEYCNGEPKQQWTFTHLGGGWHTVHNGLSGQCLTQDGTNTKVSVASCSSGWINSRLWGLF